MSISYHRADERPPWNPTVRLNGTLPDLSEDGWTFLVLVGPTEDGEAVLQKPDNITGGVGGSVIVDWQPNELDLPPATYAIQLIGTKDDQEFTVFDDLIIRPRMTVPAP